MRDTRQSCKIEETDMKRLAVYLRENADCSIEDMIAKYKNQIEKRGDCEIVDFYADRGKSGRDKHRPEYERMLVDAQNHKFDYIVVKSLAKFSRDTAAALKAIDKLKEYGVGLYTINEKIDTLGSEYGIYRAMLTTLLAMA